VHEPSVFEVERTIKKLKRQKSPVIEQMPAEFIKAGIETIRSEIHTLINSA